MNSKNEKKAIFLLMGLGAIMDSFLFIRNPNMGGDGLRSLLPIHNLVAGKGYTLFGNPEVFMPPGYGAIGYIFFLLFRDIELSGMLPSAISYLLIIPTTYCTVRFLFGKRSAFLASFFVTFCPILIRFSYVSLSDVMFSFFFLLSFSIFVRIILGESTFLYNILLGMLFGITYLIKPEMFLVAVLALVSLFMFSIVDGRRSAESRTAPYPILATIAFLIFLLPYMVFIHKHTGNWTFTTKTARNLIVAGETVVEGPRHTDILAVEHPEYFKSSYRVNYIEYIRSRGGKFFERIRRNALAEILILARISFHALVPLALLLLISPFLLAKKRLAGLRFGNPFDNRGIRIILSFVIFLSPLPVLLIFFVATRYLLAYSLLILILLSFLTVRLLEKIVETFGTTTANQGLILICGISLLSLSSHLPFINAPSSLYKTLTERHGHLGLRAAGLWLRDNVQDIDNLSIIAPRKGAVALLYACNKKELKGRALGIPINMDLKAVKDIISNGEADYLLIDKLYISTRPQLIPLWKNPNTARDFGLLLVYKDSEGLFQIYSAANERDETTSRIRPDHKRERYCELIVNSQYM